MKTILLPLLSGTILLSACSGATIEQKYPTSQNRKSSTTDDPYEETDGIFGEGGILSLGKDKKSTDEGGNIGVNTYLWRASLDTVSFMPIISADPFGGTILTDWYEDQETPGTRYKLNVFILDRELKSDGVRVRVFKQMKKNKIWTDVPAAEDMGTQLEDSILSSARMMRAKKLGSI